MKLNKLLTIAAVTVFCVTSQTAAVMAETGTGEEIYSDYEETDAADDSDMDEEKGITWKIENGTLTITGESEGGWDRFDTDVLTDAERLSVKHAVVTARGLISAFGMFDECTNLESVDLKGMDTSVLTDVSYMFDECSSLKSIDLGGMDFSHVEDMHSMFYGCAALKNIDISGMDISSVTSMRKMFADCSKLETVNMKGLTGTKVTDLSQMFYGCSNLKSIDTTGIHIQGAENLSGMFEECSSLQEIDIKGIDTSDVKDMSYMFSECHALKSIDVSSMKTEKVNNMTGMFDSAGLTSLDLSKCSLTGLLLERNFYIIGGCSNLTELKLPANMPVSVSLPWPIVPGKTYYWVNANNQTCDCTTPNLPMAMTYTRKEKVDEYVNIVPPEDVINNTPQTPNVQQDSSVKPSENMPAVGTKFTDAKSSGKYSITGSNTVTYTGSKKAGAKTVTIPPTVSYQGKTYKVTAVAAKALKGNKKVTTVKIGSNVTKIGNNAFDGCKKLKTIQISSSKLKSVGKNAFKGIHAKAKIKVPSKKYSAYKKLLKGKGQKSSVKISK